MKTFIIVALILIQPLISLSQEFGIKGGINIANIRTSVDGSAEQENAVIDFHGGVYGEFILGEYISLQPEIFFSKEGAKNDVFGADSRVILNTLQVPVLIKLNIGELVNIQIGPQVGFLLSSKIKVEDSSFETDEIFRTVLFSATGGLGIELSPAIELGARYNLGLTDIFDDDNSDLRTTSNVGHIFLSFRIR